MKNIFLTAALAFCLAVPGFGATAATVTADQGQIFSTGGTADLGTAFHSQSVTTGIAGQLTGIQVQFHNFESNSGIPAFAVIPTIDFSVYSGANPVSGTSLFSNTYSFLLSDFTTQGLYTFNLLAGNLFFGVGDVFTFTFQASSTGFSWAGNDVPGYSGGDLYVNGVLSAPFDIAFISYVTPIPLPAGLPLFVAALGLLVGLGRRYGKRA